MSENLSRTELVKKNRKILQRKQNRRTFTIIALVAFLVYISGLYGTSLAYFNDFISSTSVLFQFGSGFPVEDDFSRVTQNKAMFNAICTLDDNFVNVYSPTGKKVLSYNHSMKDPYIDVSDNRILLYNANQTSFKVLNFKDVIFSKELKENIIHADTSSSNKIAVTSTSESFNGQVTVYDYMLNEDFVWYCANNYPIYSKLSDNGKTLAVATAGSDNGLISSEIYIIDTVNGLEKLTIKYNDYPLNIEFVTNDKILIAYSNKIVLYDVLNNKEISNYQLGVDSILSIDVKTPYITVALGNYDADLETKVILFNDKLESICNIPIKSTVKDICLSQSRLFILTEDYISEYDYNGNLRAETLSDYNNKNIMDFGGTVLMSSTEMNKIEKTNKE